MVDDEQEIEKLNSIIRELDSIKFELLKDYLHNVIHID